MLQKLGWAQVQPNGPLRLFVSPEVAEKNWRADIWEGVGLGKGQRKEMTGSQIHDSIGSDKEEKCFKWEKDVGTEWGETNFPHPPTQGKGITPKESHKSWNEAL